MIENLYGEAPGAAAVDPSNELSVVAQLANLAAPYAVRVAATLRLADLIEAGTCRLDELATKAGADPDALNRLMRFLVVRGVFAEPEPGVFAMTPSAQVLTSGHPMGVRGWLDLEGPAAGRMDVSFTGLLDAVRTGETAYPKLFGQSAWEDFETNPDIGAAFGALMSGRAASFVPDLVKAYEWSGHDHVVDVGGGTGLLLAELLQEHPAMTATLVDLPALVPHARARFDAVGVSDRVAAVEGSMFAPLPAGGDLYVLASILHDWSDQDAATILRRCAEAAGPGQRILVVDRTSDHGNPLTFTFMNLLMLAFLGGRERTIAEFATLGEAAGLVLDSASPIPCGLSTLTFVVPISG